MSKGHSKIIRRSKSKAFNNHTAPSLYPETISDQIQIYPNKVHAEDCILPQPITYEKQKQFI